MQLSYAEKIDNHEIQSIIDKDRIHYHIPSLSVSISLAAEDHAHDFVSGTTLFSGTIPIQPNNLFQIGSITKSFVSAILLQLESEEKISLDDAISKWLLIKPEWRNITIRQLLNHTSGIYNYTDTFDELMQTGKNVDLNTNWTSLELVKMAAAHPLYFPPGQGWHYSNSNYVLAGMIVESLTGNQLAAEMQKRIFSPLHLQNTYYQPTIKSILTRMAHGYSQRGYFSDEPKDITAFNLSWANAAGSIVSTAHDTTQWFRKLMSGALLPPEQMKELTTVVSTRQIKPFNAKEAGYGLGIGHDHSTFGEESWWHSGGMLGYTSIVVWLKEQDTVITVVVGHISKDRDVYYIAGHLADYLRARVF